MAATIVANESDAKNKKIYIKLEFKNKETKYIDMYLLICC